MSDSSVWLVMGEVGSYDDYCTWPVASFSSEEEAQKYAKAATDFHDHLCVLVESWERDPNLGITVFCVDKKAEFIVQNSKFDPDISLRGKEDPVEYTVRQIPHYGSFETFEETQNPGVPEEEKAHISLQFLPKGKFIEREPGEPMFIARAAIAKIKKVPIEECVIRPVKGRCGVWEVLKPRPTDPEILRDWREYEQSMIPLYSPHHADFWSLAREAEQEGLITIREFAEGEDLYILNYTNKASAEGSWPYFIQNCRGLIVTKKDIIARPFPKFFNLNEQPETREENLPQEEPSVTFKEDGSLGILFWWKNAPFISTRGSFHSPQAQWATQFFRKNFIDVKWLRNYTYLFEIIYPENRIVIDYEGKEELLLLGAIHTQKGTEVSYSVLKQWAHTNQVPIVRHYSWPSLSSLLTQKEEIKHEGWVLRYPNGLRVKIKGREYVRISRILRGITHRRIIDVLRTSDNFGEIVAGLPEDLQQEAISVATYYGSIADALEKGALDWWGMCEGETHKERALWIQNNVQEDMHKFVFCLMRDRNLTQAIWKHIWSHRKEYRRAYMGPELAAERM